MANGIITIQLGQCGNQIGLEFWKSLCHDHGIGSNGERLDKTGLSSNTDVFFYQADDKRYIPRSVLVDLEPRVINCIMNSEYSKLFAQENVLIAPEGGGAGNNWGKGYAQSHRMEEDVFEIVDRMSEDCESLDGIMILHSMAGGTGSGMGSHVLECLADRYPKKTVQTFSVFPQQGEMGDVIVQAYNSLLMLERLITHVDSVLVLNNGSFLHILESQLEKTTSNYHEINALIVKLMNILTNPLRFPTYQYSTLTSLTAPLSPTPSMHFLTASLTPWNATMMRKKKSLRRVMYDLLKPKNMVIPTKTKSSLKHGYLAIFDIIHGNYSPTKLFDAIGYIRENQFAKFVPWVPDSMQVLLAKSSPSFLESNSSSGLMLANHTSMGAFLGESIQHFDKLKKHSAFLGAFQDTGVFSEDFAEMDVAREVADCLLQEYRAATKSDFLSWKPQRG